MSAVNVSVVSDASVSKYRVMYSKDAGKKRMVYNDGFLVVNRKLQGGRQSVTATLFDESDKELRRMMHHTGQVVNYAVGEEVSMMQFSVQIEECVESKEGPGSASKAEPTPIDTKQVVESEVKSVPSSSSSQFRGNVLPRHSNSLLSNKLLSGPRANFKPLTPRTLPIDTTTQINAVQSSTDEVTSLGDIVVKQENDQISKENNLNQDQEPAGVYPPISYVGVGYTKLVAKPSKFKSPLAVDVRATKEKVNLAEIPLDSSIMKVMKEHQIVGANFLLDKVLRKPVVVTTRIEGNATDELHEEDEESDNLYDTDEEEEQRKRAKRQKQATSSSETQTVSKNQAIRGCILADEMGLGKTLTTLSVLFTLMQHEVCKSVIVTPSSLVDNWANEAKKWLHTKMQPLVIKAGTDANAIINTFAISRISKYPILIISYELFRKHVDAINSAVSGMDMIVCDEGHRLKNIDGTKTIEALKRCKAKMRIVLTGTPIQNDIEELYSLVSFVAPNLLGTLQHFKRLYSDHINGDDIWDEDSGANNDEQAALASLLGSIILRRTQQEVLSKLLPPRTDFVVKCRLSPLQATVYDQVVEEAKRSLDGGDNVVDDVDVYGAAPSSSCILPALQSLRRICVTALQEASKPLRSKLSSNVKGPSSSKLLIVETLIAEIRRQCPTDKIVLVSSQIPVLDAVYDQVICKRGWGPVHRLDGTVPVQDRQRMVDAFNRSAITAVPKPAKFRTIQPKAAVSDIIDPFIFLLSTKAGGVGINLIGANRLIMLDIEWNPASDKQAMSRVWRQGQKKAICIYRLIAADSIEESMLERQSKKGAFESLLDSDSSKATSSSGDADTDKSFALGKLTSSDFHKLVYPANSSMMALREQAVDTVQLRDDRLQVDVEELGDAPLQEVIRILGTEVLTSVDFHTCAMVEVEESL